MPYIHKNEELMTVDEAIAMLQEISAEGKGGYHLTMNQGCYGFCLKGATPIVYDEDKTVDVDFAP